MRREMIRKAPLVLALLLLVAAVGLTPAGAQDAGDTTTLRLAVLAPRGSTWHRVFSAWNNSLRSRTGGRLTIRLENRNPGDERQIVSQMQSGQLDGGCFNAVGLGLIAKPMLVLQAPGVFDDYAKLDRARERLDSELRSIFEQNGATLIGWSDFGRGRIFAKHPIARPGDAQNDGAWVLPADPLAPAYFSALGARPVELPLSEVRGALDAGRTEITFASASAVAALQWPLTHVTEQGGSPLVGATLVRKETFDRLAPDLQQALLETGQQATQSLNRLVRREDDRYYQTLTTRQGIQPVNGSAHAAEWRRAQQQARERLVGEVYSRQLLDRVVAAAR